MKIVKAGRRLKRIGGYCNVDRIDGVAGWDRKNVCVWHTLGSNELNVTLTQTLNGCPKSLRTSCNKLVNSMASKIDLIKLKGIHDEYYYQLILKDFREKIEEIFSRYSEDDVIIQYAKTLLKGVIKDQFTYSVFTLPNLGTNRGKVNRPIKLSEWWNAGYLHAQKVITEKYDKKLTELKFSVASTLRQIGAEVKEESKNNLR